MGKFKGLLIVGMFFFSSHMIFAQNLIYTPKNPAFGGNTFNYQWMLSSAQAQNTYDAPRDGLDPFGSQFDRNPIDDFAESLNRQILSRLSRELINRQFGEEGLTEGQYTLGDYQIDIGNSEGGIEISIVDNTTGATTNVSVPYF
jgi:curli production assembly/transport component CsgF